VDAIELLGQCGIRENCITYFSVPILTYSFEQVLAMRKRIKMTGFSDWETMFYNNLLSIPVLVVFSVVVEDWGSANLTRNL